MAVLSGLKEKIIATCVVEQFHYEFISEADRVVAKVYDEQSFKGVFELDRSYQKIEAIPLDYRSSPHKMINWLVNESSHFIPVVTINGVSFISNRKKSSNLNINIIEDLVSDFRSNLISREEMSKKASVIIALLPNIAEADSLLARKGYLKLLAIVDTDELILEIYNSLEELFSPQTLEYDIEYESIQELQLLENELRQRIDLFFDKTSVLKLNIGLLIIRVYIELLERLVLLVYLGNDPNLETDFKSSRNLVQKKVSDWSSSSQEWLHTRKLKKFFQSIHAILSDEFEFYLNDDDVKGTLESCSYNALTLCGYLGHYHFLVMNYQRAIYYYKTEIEYIESIVTNVDEGDEIKELLASLYRRLGNLYLNIGKSKKAKLVFNKYLNFAIEKNDLFKQINAYGLLGDIAIARGKAAKGKKHFKKQLEMLKRTENLGYSSELAFQESAKTLSEIGSGFLEASSQVVTRERNQGQGPEKITDNDEAKYRTEVLELHESAQAGLSICYRILGKYKKAIDYSQKSFALAKQLKDKVRIIKNYNNLGLIDEHLGKTDEAFSCFFQALEENKSLANEKLKSIIYGNIGDAYSNLHYFDEAIIFYNKQLIKSEDDFEKVGVLANIGSSYYFLGKYDQAKDFSNMARKLSKEIDAIDTEILALTVLGNIEVELSHYDEAFKLYEESLEKAEKVHELRTQGIICNNIARLFYKKNDLLEAEKIFTQAINIFNVLQMELEENYQAKVTIFEQLSIAYLGLERVLLDQKKTDEALEITDARRSKALVSSLLGKLGLKERTSLTSSEIRAFAEKINTTFVVYSFIEGKKEASVWIISSQNALVYETVDIGVILKDLEGFEELLKNTPFERTRGKSPDVSIPCLKEFEELVRGDELLAVQLARQEFIEEKLGPWYQSLISPIEKHLPSDPNQIVTIIPDGFLAQFPFAAFHDASDGKYLIEKHPISIAPSIYTLKILDKIALSRNPEEYSKQALIIGNPTLNEPKYAELAIGEQEAEEVARLFNSKLLKRAEATVANFVQQASQAHWIFASCHGEADCKPDYDPYSVFEGQLKFSPDPEYPTGNLHSQLISTLDLKAELVFLSACYSGTGKVQQEGTIGNVWSFLSAGALSTVASYWPLKESETTKEMVNCFYKHMLGMDVPKLNKAQALQKAMMLGMEKGRDNVAQWGAFFFSGLNE